MPPEQPATNSSPAHWSKDFVEHLRSIHFTLIGISIGLIVIVLSAKPYNPAVALRQIHQIIQFKKTWSLNWLMQKGVKKDMRQTDADDDDESDTKHPAPSTPNQGRKVEATDFFALGDKTEWSGDPLLPDPRRVQRVELPRILASKDNFLISGTDELYGHFDTKKSPNTTVHFLFKQKWEQNHTDPDWSPASFPGSVYEFHQWWDALAGQHYRALIPRTIDLRGVQLDLFDDPDYPDYAKISLSHKPSSGKADSFETVDMTMTVDATRGTLEYLDEDKRGYFYKFPVRKFIYAEVSQSLLGGEFKNWKTGRFTDSFPELARAAQDLDSLELEDAVKFISTEAAKGSEVFEAFGMKFPTGQITLWGIVILLGVQLYFYMYLSQLSGKLAQNDTGWDVPWLGMNTSFIAQTVFFLTVIIFPCFAIGLLGGHSILQTNEPLAYSNFPPAKTAGLISALIAAMVLGIASWRGRPKIREQV